MRRNSLHLQQNLLLATSGTDQYLVSILINDKDFIICINDIEIIIDNCIANTF